MILQSQIAQAIYTLYPQVASTVEDIAYDADGNEVVYDMEAVLAEAEKQVNAKEATKESALSKLKALGLTDDEISALKGTL